MDAQVGNYSHESEEDMDIRKGPWTDAEDSILTNYVMINGEGRWNSVARCSGLKRTGKSCRLRWLNYLRPDVRRGNITLQEQLLILELHSHWGNRWSKIAQHLPGRTDNEIKNYWRTRVQKQAKQLKCDVNSKQFRDAMRNVWIPRLIERIQAEPESSPMGQTTSTTYSTGFITDQIESGYEGVDPNFMPELSDYSLDTQVSSASDLTDCQKPPRGYCSDGAQNGSGLNPENYNSGSWEWHRQGLEDMQMQGMEQQGNNGLLEAGDHSLEEFWTDENIWILQQQLLM